LHHLKKSNFRRNLYIRMADLKIKFAVLTASLLLVSCAGSLTKSENKLPDSPLERLGRQIDQVLGDSLLKQSHAGIKIVSLANGETLYAHDSAKLLNPASNMKLLTTATALERLGADFHFRTVLYADSGTIGDTAISGNLYLKGYGNPDLTTDDLNLLADDLRGRGISKISGDLVCDDTYFDDLYRGEGWMWDDASSWYFAPIGALSVNDNCVTVIVKAGKRPGDSLSVVLEPHTRYIKIENEGITVDSTDSLSIANFKVEREWKNPKNTVTIQGGIVAGAPPESTIVDVVDPTLYTGTLFAEILQQKNIHLLGAIVHGQTPGSVDTVFAHMSEPLSLVVYNTNKISDNLSAEQILKTVGAEKKGLPGTARKGVSVVKGFLQSAGVDSSSYYIVDGSGVSRYDLVSPDLLVELLRRMHQDFEVQPEFESSLPVAGADGTLEHRMQNGPAYKKVRAKTGSLRGVSSLSGYTKTADGELVAFSMMMSDFVKPASRIRKLQDRICELIASFSRKPALPGKSLQTTAKNQ
jgi:D-alanyl-D-alanine carboxypeptidase/D-alanyl-D-alanine-endopeptidase (penicillin-binding protein 4)